MHSDISLTENLKNYLKNSSAEPLAVWLMAAMVFFLPLNQKVAAWLIFLFVLVSVLNNKNWLNPAPAFKDRMNLLLIGFFFLHVAGLAYSDNLSYALADLQTKLSFLIFPLMMTGRKSITGKLRFITVSFVSGIVLAGLIGMVYAVFRFLRDGNPSVFLYEDYAVLMHPTHFTLYINFAMLIVMEPLVKSWIKPARTRSRMLMLIMAFLLINVILLNARMATLAVYGSLLLYCFFLFRKYNVYGKGILVVAVSLLICLFLHYLVLRINPDRFNQLKQLADQENAKENEKEKMNSVHIRWYLWDNAIRVIKENPVFGVGTGDIKEALMEKYRENNFSLGLERNYSPHNQYLHTAVILGLTGLALLLAILAYSIVKGAAFKDPVLVLFMIIIVINCLTEDILEVQKGILFFCCFHSLYYWKNLNGTEPALVPEPGNKWNKPEHGPE